MRAAPALALLALAACGAPQNEAERCAAGAQPRLVAQLFFGRNIGDRVGVSDGDWTAFLDGEVTPRFPNGLTVYDAQGQWRDTATGAIVHEPSKALTLILDDEAGGRRAVAEVARAYRERFHQQAVGVVYERSCVSF